MHIIYTIGWKPFTQILNEGLKRIEVAHGFYITFAGMLAVFLGLVVLWFSVFFFRKLVSSTIQKETKPKTMEIDSTLSLISMTQTGEDVKLAAIIAATLAYYEEFEEDPVRILPLKDMDQEMSPWVVVAREQMLRKF